MLPFDAGVVLLSAAVTSQRCGDCTVYFSRRCITADKKITGSYSYVCATVVIGFMVLHFLWSFMMEIFIFIITLYGDGGCILI